MIGGNSNQDLLTAEMNSGGLKITYEKQVDSINTEVDMELELDTTPSANVEVPVKRGRWVIIIHLFIFAIQVKLYPEFYQFL